MKRKLLGGLLVTFFLVAVSSTEAQSQRKSPG